MSRYIVCTNNDDATITFGDDFSPFLLQDAIGLYEAKFNVAQSENTNKNGSTYYGSRQATRNIVLTLSYSSDKRTARDALYALFRPDLVGTLSYFDDDDERIIDYVVENVYVDPEYDRRTATVSLICPDPLFKSGTEYIVNIATWMSNFEFLHEFSEDGEELGYQNASQTGTIENASSVSGTGVEIVLEVSGTVTNPSIYNIENGQHITLGDSNNTLTLLAGDVVTITTGVGNKHIYLTSGGTTTEINEYLTEDSEFITLLIGTNTIGYTADSGEEYMALTVTYRYEYLGA